MQRLIGFFNTNFKQAIELNCIIAKEKIDMIIHKIFPSTKELVKILKKHRG